MEPWILIGMMGAGKSTVGTRLAEYSNREFLDTDTLIVNRLGRSIDKIFEFYGEQSFRDHETSIIRSLIPGNYVLSTGGGAVVREENWSALSTLGKTIYLKVPPTQLKERLLASRRRRPLLETEDWEGTFDSLYAVRTPLYERAQLVIEVDVNSPEEAAQVILMELQHG
jgi:shikimate kinase